MSLMNHEQLLFNGCFQALLSNENQNGLECLRAGVKKFSKHIILPNFNFVSSLRRRFCCILAFILPLATNLPRNCYSLDYVDIPLKACRMQMMISVKE